MATYVLLLTLTPDGRAAMLDDPESLLRAEHQTEVPGVDCMGLYAVLGDYDFVSLLEAPDNEAAARFSLELGVRGGAHVLTLPAVPIGLLERPARPAGREDVTGVIPDAGPERSPPPSQVPPEPPIEAEESGDLAPV